MQNHFLTYLAPGITLAYTLSFLTGELRLFWYGWRTHNWADTRGTILHSEMRTGPAPVTWGRGRVFLRYPSVIYRYTVDGTTYHGSHLGYRGDWSDFSRTLPWKAGNAVEIRYSPLNPSEAVLQHGIGFGNWLGITLGLTAVGLSVYWLTFLVRAA